MKAAAVAIAAPGRGTLVGDNERSFRADFGPTRVDLWQPVYANSMGP